MAKPPRWFVTAQFARPPRGAYYDFELIASSLTHAKEWGTDLTACGRDCATWFKFWATPFTADGQDRCPECVVAVFGQAAATQAS